MKPSEVIKMRDRLASELIDTFSSSIDLNHDRNEVVDWLIEMGWVTEAPSDNAN